MPELKMKQLQYECNTWKRLLGFMMEENIYMKNRLSEVLKDQFDKNLLDDVESFQNRLIEKDELNGSIRKGISELDHLLNIDSLNDGNIIKEVDKRFTNLRNNITSAEKHFGKLKLEFNCYLTENI